MNTNKVVWQIVFVENMYVIKLPPTSVHIQIPCGTHNSLLCKHLKAWLSLEKKFCKKKFVSYTKYFTFEALTYIFHYFCINYNVLTQNNKLFFSVT